MKPRGLLQYVLVLSLFYFFKFLVEAPWSMCLFSSSISRKHDVWGSRLQWSNHLVPRVIHWKGQRFIRFRLSSVDSKIDSIDDSFDQVIHSSFDVGA